MIQTEARRQFVHGSIQGPAKQPHPSDKHSLASLAWVYVAVLVAIVFGVLAA